MKPSKREARYRMKIIQENNYNKAEQKILDEAAAEMPRSYKDIYEAQKSGVIYWFMAVIGAERTARAFFNMGNSFNEFAEAFEEYSKTAKEMCRAEVN